LKGTSPPSQLRQQQERDAALARRGKISDNIVMELPFTFFMLRMIESRTLGEMQAELRSALYPLLSDALNEPEGFNPMDNTTPPKLQTGKGTDCWIRCKLRDLPKAVAGPGYLELEGEKVPVRFLALKKPSNPDQTPIVIDRERGCSFLKAKYPAEKEKWEQLEKEAQEEKKKRMAQATRQGPPAAVRGGGAGGGQARASVNSVHAAAPSDPAPRSENRPATASAVQEPPPAPPAPDRGRAAAQIPAPPRSSDIPLSSHQSAVVAVAGRGEQKRAREAASRIAAEGPPRAPEVSSPCSSAQEKGEDATSFRSPEERARDTKKTAIKATPPAVKEHPSYVPGPSSKGKEANPGFPFQPPRERDPSSQRPRAASHSPLRQFAQ